ncbi:hypothetical protein TSUD_293510 [Trifolium subterraneum]|uniref:Uncharacterized protein n=1 Tax=Trifolium subterraneum TaxID=3900 RepID=A0A2Z6NB57_TRISU|nr:hypothetical protein TSUD_293510 [Trifolium subterraneum]
MENLSDLRKAQVSCVSYNFRNNMCKVHQTTIIMRKAQKSRARRNGQQQGFLKFSVLRKARVAEV